MVNKLRCTKIALLVGIFWLPAWSASAVTLGQFDDFQDGSVMGWEVGAPSSLIPTNIANGGPGGAGDNYLQHGSDGSSGPGGRLVMLNNTQWTGDFLSAGVTAITMQAANFGNTDLDLRIALSTSNISAIARPWFASTNPFVLPADGVWREVTFGLSANDLELVSNNPATLNAVLSGVTQFRILSNSASDFKGAVMTGTVGVDNISAVPLPGALWLFFSALGWAGIFKRKI